MLKRTTPKQPLAIAAAVLRVSLNVPSIEPSVQDKSAHTIYRPLGRSICERTGRCDEQHRKNHPEHKIFSVGSTGTAFRLAGQRSSQWRPVLRRNHTCVGTALCAAAPAFPGNHAVAAVFQRLELAQLAPAPPPLFWRCSLCLCHFAYRGVPGQKNRLRPAVTGSW